MKHAPICLARNLAELPLCSANIGDSLKILSEIETIKLQIKLIENNQLKMMHTIVVLSISNIATSLKRYNFEIKYNAS